MKLPSPEFDSTQSRDISAPPPTLVSRCAREPAGCAEAELASEELRAHLAALVDGVGPKASLRSTLEALLALTGWHAPSQRAVVEHDGAVAAIVELIDGSVEGGNDGGITHVLALKLLLNVVTQEIGACFVAAHPDCLPKLLGLLRRVRREGQQQHEGPLDTLIVYSARCLTNIASCMVPGQGPLLANAGEHVQARVRA
jgi:hypothetical protein